MRCPICDQEIDRSRVFVEGESECCPLCRALALDSVEPSLGGRPGSSDASRSTAEASLTPVIGPGIEDSFNWY
jgi:hypothetical protein